jgi:ubiquinone/menaquinone biosynthesis C-methylase UbiE
MIGRLHPIQRKMTFPWPLGPSGRVVWTERGFCAGEDTFPVLKYDVGDSGWTDELTELHEAEAGSNHYIDVASREHALRCVRTWVPPSGIIMDIGCSSGFMLRLLREEFPDAQLVGVDYVSGPLEKLNRHLPSVPLMQFDLTACPLEDACADAIIALNVLEHIPDDGKAIRQMFRILKPRGKAIIEVPEGPGLYDIYDRQLLHHRRYRMADLISQFEQNGFQILEKSHLGFFLYPAFWLVKKWNRRYLTASAQEQHRRVEASIRTARQSPLMTAVMKWEAILRTRVPFPVGIRCLLVAERPAR